MTTPQANDVLSIATGRLRFDTQNPRYAHEAFAAGRNDTEIIRYLYENDDLGELLQSIANNGFIDMEPLIVTRLGSDESDDTFTVLEGNRRLAAIRLLDNSQLCATLRINCPPISDEKRATLSCVRAIYVSDRSAARSFIGFKHINGPHRWDALAKAQFAADWFGEAGPSGVTLTDIAQRLGDSHSTVLRLVHGYYVLQQAETSGVFDRETRSPGRKFAFSHLYTALTRPGYRRYLGLPPDWRGRDPTPNPVEEGKLKELGRVMTWLYGSRDGQPPLIKSQNPDIKNLGDVLEKPEALHVLEVTNDLSQALKQVEPADRVFQNALVEAKLKAEVALSQVGAFTGEDETLLDTAESLRKTSVRLAKTMRSIVDGDLDDDA